MLDSDIQGPHDERKVFVTNELLRDTGKGLKMCVLSRPPLIYSTPIKQLPIAQSHLQQKWPSAQKSLSISMKMGLQANISPPKICISS